MAPRQPLSALRRGRKGAPPAVAGTHRVPLRSNNPATAACPAATAAGVHDRANPEANGAAIRVGDAS